MSIADEVTAQIKDAMKAKDERRLAALRSMRTAFLNEMKKDGATSVPDEVAEGLLRKLEKQRKESIEAFSGAGREEMAEAERAELAVIQSFLPQLADEPTTRAWVEAAIAETGAASPRDMGKVMGALMKAHKAEIDGNLAREIVQSLLK
ncbi:MAG: GatB/YqeY domain-containing protein [Spirochaetaceae bacterium]|nr:GatB/YqeY domain-containing protein [Myxococcales bacterium]MCB9722737.1 GatB/YqeY domain-containing protein [Spirochaetaceae bacterium]